MLKKILISMLFILLASCSNYLNFESKNSNNQLGTSEPEVYNGQNQNEPVAVQAKVAMLVPLSGKNAELGKNLLDAANLALFDSGDASIKLVPYDSGTASADAVAAARKAVEDGVKIIIGPVFSSEARAVAPVASQYNVNVISFSNDKSMKNSGVFFIGMMPEQQIDAIIKYADSIGVKSMKALLPKDNFGMSMSEQISRTLASGASQNSLVVESKIYDLDSKGNPQNIDKYLELSSQNSGTYGSDAFLIPDGGRRLAIIADRLKEVDVGVANPLLFGTAQWQDQDIANASLDGAFFAATPSARLYEFEDRFESTYGYKASKIASLSYDAVALVVTLSKLSNGQDFSRTAITNPRGFVGVNGIFKFAEDGSSTRGLDIIKVQNGQRYVVLQSPSSF